MIREITAETLNPQRFIDEQIQAIAAASGEGPAVNALSGGVDSSVVTMLGHRALGDRLKTVFIENGLMRDGRRDYGLQIEVRCWDSLDAREARPTRLPMELLLKLAQSFVDSVPGVVSVTYNITRKPPSTMEAV